MTNDMVRNGVSVPYPITAPYESSENSPEVSLFESDHVFLCSN
jgi:hypothetical protein